MFFLERSELLPIKSLIAHALISTIRFKEEENNSSYGFNETLHGSKVIEAVKTNSHDRFSDTCVGVFTACSLAS